MARSKQPTKRSTSSSAVAKRTKVLTVNNYIKVRL
jgi:hypothetical protein